MRHAYLCGDDVRLEFCPDKGVAYATVSVDGDLEERAAAPCSPDSLRAVVHGLKYHIAGSEWMCSISRQGDRVELDVWRDGAPRKRCSVPLQEYEAAIGLAFGARQTAYLA